MTYPGSTMKTGILLAAFGTASPQGEAALRLFTLRIRNRFPDIPVRWAFTSSAMRERLAGGARRKSDSVDKALRKMAFERFRRVAVQPLHVVPGFEYEEVLDTCAQARELFEDVQVGLPLLVPKMDPAPLAATLLAELPAERKSTEAVLFVGHGSRHDASHLIGRLGEAVRARDPLAFTATMKGDVTLETILPFITASKASQIWMLPLLAVVGRHMLEDLAGNHSGSWKTRLEAAGLSCVPVLRGMVEYPLFSRIWADNLAQAIAALSISDNRQ